MEVDPRGWARNVLDVHGAAGAEWLKRLPALISECAGLWSLELLPPFEGLSYSFVAPAIRRHGASVVVKAGVPGLELSREAEALRCFEGRGMVRLLEADLQRGVLLLERLRPGTPLEDQADDEQLTRVAAQVMSSLWRPAPAEHDFATIAEWAKGLKRLRARFGGGPGPFPGALVDQAERLFEELLGSDAEPVLLHGDLHAQNILKSEREPWLAIDPKGVVGDRMADAARFVWSVPGEPSERELRRRLKRRADQLAEALGFDRGPLLDWALAQAVLAGCWSFEDHGGGWEWALVRAGVLASLR
jgi:streptomycin 6-kinase